MTEVVQRPQPRPGEFLDNCSNRAATSGRGLRTEGVLVTVSGRLDETTAPKFRMRVVQLLAVPHEALTLDLHGVDSIDAAGVEALSVARREAGARGIAFALVAVPAHVRERLDRADSG